MVMQSDNHDVRLSDILDRIQEQTEEGVDFDQCVEQHCLANPELAELIRRGTAALRLLRTATADVRTLDESPLDGRLVTKVLGDFHLVRQLGRGGMGVVYEADQISMGRRVALKILPFAALAEPKCLLRFKNEVRAAASLDHGNIVSIYSVGESSGVHYYAMQLIRGQNLASVIHELRRDKTTPNDARADIQLDLLAFDEDSAASPISQHTIDTTTPASSLSGRTKQDFFKTVARIGIQVAEAIHHAHDQNVIHRDIKPANLMLDFEGVVYITDFGLARIEAETGVTMSKDMVGTLRYMSPEQAIHHEAIVDHRTDIYSLGATLYELLTLRPAYDADSPQDILHMMTFREPTPLRKLDRSIPEDLETIVGKAMSHSPGDRYPTAQAMADDLRRYLAHQPIRARSPTLRNWITKWQRRNPRIAFVLLAFLTISVVAMIAGLQFHNSRLSRLNRELIAKEAKLNDMVVVAKSRMAFEALAEGDTLTTSRMVEEIKSINHEGSLGFEWNLLKRIVEQYRPQFELKGHVGSVAELAISPTGEQIVSVGEDGLVRFWSSYSGQAIGNVDCSDGNLAAVAISNDGELLAVGSKRIGLFDLPQRKFVRWLSEFDDDSAHVESIAFSPDGQWIAGGYRYDRIQLHNLKTGVVSEKQTDSRQDSLLFTPDSRQLLGSARPGWPDQRDTICQVWDVKDQGLELAGRFPAPSVQPSFRCIAAPADGKWIAVSGPGDGRIYFFSTKQREVVNIIDLRGDSKLNCLDVSHDGEFVAAGYGNGTVRRLQYPGNPGAIHDELEHAIQAHAGELTCLKFLPDNRIVTAGKDGIVRLWPRFVSLFETVGVPNSDGIELSRLNIDRGPKGEVCGSIITYDGRKNGLKLFQGWPPEWADPVVPFPAGSTVRAPGNDAVFLGLGNGQVIRFDVRRGKMDIAITLGSENVNALALSPDQSRLAVAIPKGKSQKSSVVLLDAVNLKELRRYDLNESNVALQYSEDGRYLAAGQLDGRISIHDGYDLKQIRTLETNRRVTCLCWRSSNELISGHEDGEIHIWCTSDGTDVNHLIEHSLSVSDIALSPDKKSLVSASLDGTLRLWRVRDGAYLGLLYDQKISFKNTFLNDIDSPTLMGMSGVQFSHDGKYIFATRYDSSQSRNLLVFPCE
jgi:serine/threonine protein kinase/WD40 repeat protein